MQRVQMMGDYRIIYAPEFNKQNILLESVKHSGPHSEKQVEG
jgi:mRNA-degrading endonuclease RelE of RelBE toxin-antitoxin system